MGPFRGFGIRFVTENDGTTTRLNVNRPGHGADLEFSRKQDQVLHNRLDLEGFAAEYELQGRRLTVFNEDDALCITGDGLPRYRLQALDSETFELVNTPGYFVRFLRDGQHPGIVVGQPNGSFSMTRVH